MCAQHRPQRCAYACWGGGCCLPGPPLSHVAGGVAGQEWPEDEMPKWEVIFERALRYRQGFWMVRRIETRRDFIRSTGNAGFGVLCGTPFYRLYKKMMTYFIDKQEEMGQYDRKEYIVPEQSTRITVETALNSRCTSDYDGDPCYFHWGMFDPKRKITQSLIERIIKLAKPPRFTESMIDVRGKQDSLTFVIENGPSGICHDWAMIESGMQQQLVVLICAALGVGMVFRGLGDEGTLLSPKERATVGMKLDAMKPSYDGSYWTQSPPKGPRAWQQGNLPDPDRKGNAALLHVIPMLRKRVSASSMDLSRETVSQLLWAARGRTPHFYKGKPWGMTIPVSRGDQNITNLFLLANGQLCRYVNWTKRHPTHSVDVCRTLKKGTLRSLSSSLGINKYCLVWGRNEFSGRALWEVGYQITNVLLQAIALKCGYDLYLLNEEQKEQLEQIGVRGPAACVSVG